MSSSAATTSVSASGSVQSSNVGSSTDDSCKPLWIYVKKQERDAEGSGGGNISWECNFCHMQKTTSYTRVRAHLLKLPRLGIAGCKKVSSKDIVDMQRLEEEVKNREMANAPKKVSLPPSNMFPGGMYATGYESKKRKEAGSSRQTSPIEKSFNTEDRNQLHALIARFFYASGLPFHLARSPYECSWITIVSGDVNIIKNFIMNHSMRLAIFNEFVPLKLLSIATTRFASVIVMLKRFRLIKRSLMSMVISEKWNSYREDDVGKAKFVRDKVIDEVWWDAIDYILSFTAPIYDMLRACDTDKPCLHLVYDMWDSMIEKVRLAIYRKEGKRVEEPSKFYDVVHGILVSRWNKNNTPLHCLAHSLNPRYYSDLWLNEDPTRLPPHKDVEVARERIKCLKKYFSNSEERMAVTMEFVNFSSMSGDFADTDSIHHRDNMDPKSWWVTFGASAPLLQNLALKILVQPSSSSCAERNWSTYSFVHSVRRNQMAPKRAEDLVFIHSNLRLLSRRQPDYWKGESRMWDIAGDKFGTFEDVGELEVAHLSLDEPDLESVVFADDGDEAISGDGSHGAMDV